MLPLRGGSNSLELVYDLGALIQGHGQLNAQLEQSWAALLTVICDRWPDWPIEVWSQLNPHSPSNSGEEPGWRLAYRVYFAGEGKENPEVTAIANFLVRGLNRALSPNPEVAWAGDCFDWKPLWSIDDAQIYRLLVPEQTLAPALFQVGQYGGLPAYFASTVESWPLVDAGLPIHLADADTSWAQGTGIPS